MYRLPRRLSKKSQWVEMGMIWGKYGYDMENGKSVENWWQNIGIDIFRKEKIWTKNSKHTISK